jgi:ATP-dependent exoDNAse (exonuclease V) beta subunit
MNIAQKILENIHNSYQIQKFFAELIFEKRNLVYVVYQIDHLMTIHSSKGLEFDAVYVDLISGWNQNPKSTSD